MRRLSMGLAFALFVILLAAGRLQAWMLVLGVSVVLALVWGRVFCGWICPVNTVIELGTWFKRKLGWSDNTPVLTKNKLWGIVALSILAVVFAVSRFNGVQFPFLLILLPLGVIIAFSFSPATWHHWLCPFNALFRLTGSYSRYSQTVTPQECNGCTLCSRACPAEAVAVTDHKAEIDSSHCLQCGACACVCPKAAISYRRRKSNYIDKAVG